MADRTEPILAGYEPANTASNRFALQRLEDKSEIIFNIPPEPLRFGVRVLLEWKVFSGTEQNPDAVHASYRPLLCRKTSSGRVGFKSPARLGFRRCTRVLLSVGWSRRRGTRRERVRGVPPGVAPSDR